MSEGNRRVGGMRWMAVGASAALLIGATIFLGANASATVSHTSPEGHLVGGIVFLGNAPPGSAQRYQPGWVRVMHDGHVVAHKYVHRDKRYRFTLAPGKYGIVGQTKRGACTGRTRIRSDHTSYNNASCFFH